MIRDARVAVARIAVVAIIAVSIAMGAAGLYLYTSPQLGEVGTQSKSSTHVVTSGANGIGSQDSTGQPVGAWAQYLGYVPQGYVVAPHQLNAPTFPCPAGLSQTACALFQQSCGNGVCDPNESCSTCPIDCAPTGNLACDPYTGRPGSPASVCQAAVSFNNGPA